LTPTQTKLLQLARDGHVLAELQRREEQRWLAVDDTGVTLLLGLLGRLQAELDRAEMAGGPEPESTEAAEAVAKFEEMIAEVNELLEKLDAMAAREEDEAAVIERRCAMHSAVRPEPKVERLPSPPKPSPASPRVHRARGNAAASPSVIDDGWKFGIVKFFDKIGWSGLININGSIGMIEIPISLGAFRKSGLVNLFAGEQIECLVVTRPDGRKEAIDLRLPTAVT
jgi:hypothetical protein